MIQTLTKNWWLLALCGVLDALISGLYLVLHDQGGALSFYTSHSMVLLLAKLTLAAGLCTVAASIWRSAKGRQCWLLVLNGVALTALGVIYNFLTGFRISFLTVALLIVLMAMSTGILELITARILRHELRAAEEWLLGLAGAVSVGFALTFVALGFRWVKIEPGSHLDLLWLSCYFGFAAICMLGLGLGLRNLRSSIA